MYLSMDKIFTFTKESSLQLKFFYATNQVYDFRSISRLLNRQIKTAINLYLEQETKSILVDLDGRINKHKREYWRIDFCVVSILCLCIEEVENAIDLQYVEKPWPMPSNIVDSSSASARDCQNLDKYLYDRITELFHGMYHTDKRSTPQTKWLNPIRDGSEVDLKSKDLVEDIQNILSTHRKTNTNLEKWVWKSGLLLTINR